MAAADTSRGGDTWVAERALQDRMELHRLLDTAGLPHAPHKSHHAADNMGGSGHGASHRGADASWGGVRSASFFDGAGPGGELPRWGGTGGGRLSAVQSEIETLRAAQSARSRLAVLPLLRPPP